jgi:hypothetical protein
MKNSWNKIKKEAESLFLIFQLHTNYFFGAGFSTLVSPLASFAQQAFLQSFAHAPLASLVHSVAGAFGLSSAKAGAIVATANTKVNKTANFFITIFLLFICIQNKRKNRFIRHAELLMLC